MLGYLIGALSYMFNSGIGYSFALLSMLSAAIIEIFRRSSPILEVVCNQVYVDKGICTEELIGTMVNSASECHSYTGVESIRLIAPIHDITIFYLIIPYALLTVSESFLVYALLEFISYKIPEAQMIVGQNLLGLSIAIAILIDGLMSSVCRQWLTDNLDLGHLEFLYYIYVILSGIAIIAFSLFSHKYKKTQPYGHNSIYEPGVEYFPIDIFNDDSTTNVQDRFWPRNPYKIMVSWELLSAIWEVDEDYSSLDYCTISAASLLSIDTTYIIPEVHG